MRWFFIEFHFILISMKKIVKFLFILILSATLADGVISAQQNDEVVFYKHLALSAWNGVYYGLAADFVFEVRNEKAFAAIPIITAGTCALVPLLLNENRTMSSNQLTLTGHGQLVGWAHGFSMAAVFMGDNIFDSESNAKVAVGLGAATSIGLGLLGKSLSKTQSWSEGQVAVYRHYGLFTPMVGGFLTGTFSEDIRVYGASTLLCGAGGYLIADRINRGDNFTRGEIRATQALTVLNGALGLCIYADAASEDGPGEEFRPGLIIPAIGIALGTVLGQKLVKDTELTPRQGLTTIYAAGLGALIGSGISILVGSEGFDAIDYLIPYLSGTLSYAYIVGRYKKGNVLNPQTLLHNGGSNWNFSLMPQNILLNNSLEKKGFMINGRYAGMQPVFSASLTF